MMSEPKDKITSFGKIAFVLLGVASAALLASLVDLRMSSLLRLWIASQLIVLIIWKFSGLKDVNDISPHHYLELDLDLPPAADSPENWFSSAPDPPCEVKKEAAVTAGVQEECSMDDTWEAIMERSDGAGRRVLTKSETWEGRGSAEADAERAVARRAAALRRSDTVVLLRNSAAKTRKKRSPEDQVGWRGREKLVVGQDELFQRVETFIKNHHDHLRLQRQESEQRRFLESLDQ
ncbi:hypothetical protein Cni_G16136 [Canna indica]|uniref:Transmembrane protein n=1 Tax=Canna indica TaxID=4628 RepID=A0AAQ3QGH3_9LILI|nr:hypothetical protein Cni_G16136 [Canna indica]